LIGREPDRAHKARRPAGGEELFRIGTVGGRAGRRQLDVEASVGSAGRAVPTAGGVGLRGVQHFFDLVHDSQPLRETRSVAALRRDVAPERINRMVDTNLSGAAVLKAAFPKTGQLDAARQKWIRETYNALFPVSLVHGHERPASPAS